MDMFWASLAEFFEWVLRASIYGAVIVVVVAAVQAIGRKKLPPRWSYALWLVLLLRMVLPVGLQSGISMWNLLPGGDEPVTEWAESQDVVAVTPMPRATEDVSPSTNGALAGQGEQVIPPAGEPTQQAEAFRWKDAWRYVPGVWLAGTLLLAVSIAVSNLRLWASVRKERLVTQQGLLELFEDCKQQMGVRTVVGLVATDKVKSPSLFGFVRPRVLLPREVIEHTRAEELRYIFLHELGHLKRGDIWVGWVVAALQSLHWFNPLIWWAFARMRTDRELACDALALSYVRGEENRRYGGALVSLLERFSQSQALPAVAGILENKAQLKRRLTMITQFKRPTRRAGFVAAILLAVLAGALLTDAKENGTTATNNQTDVAATVRHAVTSIATMQESDPQIPDLLASVKALEAQATATELAEYLDHDRATMRRAAIFILWRGELETIEPALPELRKLLDHPEAETRGMTALTLGGAKDGESFDKLCELTKNDASAYTRRCTAYALGLLGDQRAVPVLKEAVKDADFNVRNNADAALVMLQEKPEISTPSSPVTPDDGTPKIVSTAPAAFDNNVSTDVKEITVTFDRKMQNGSWSWTGGGDTYPQTTGRPSYDRDRTTCRLPVKLEPGKVYWVGINSVSYKNFRSTKGVPAPWYVILFATAGADGSQTLIPDDMLAKASKINQAAATSVASPDVNMTQIMHNDIQPDGTIRFTSTIRYRYESGEPLKETHFINSDFVNVEKMYDAQKRPLKFTSQHEGNIFSYDVTFNDPVKPGEMMEYTSEGTAIGLLSPYPGSGPKALRYFMTHSPAADMPVKRVETFLLPAGARVQGQVMPAEMQQTTKDGRVELHVEKVIPTGGNLTVAFQYTMAFADASPAVTSTPANKRESEDLCQQGWKAWGAREFEKAEGLFKQAAEKDPGHDNAWQGLGWAQFNQGKPENAKQAFETCVKLNPKNSAAWNGLGWIAKGDGQEDEAIGYWEKAIEAFPGATASLSGLAQTYMEREDYRKAEKYYRQWVKAEPDNQDAKTGLEQARKLKTQFPIKTTTDADGKRVDNINYPFAIDSQVLGQWESVDFVTEKSDFQAGKKQFSGELTLKGIQFLNGGQTDGPWRWTKGLVIHPVDKTAARYDIVVMNNEVYMFMEWKSGDYSLRGTKPKYYVLKKK